MFSFTKKKSRSAMSSTNLFQYGQDMHENRLDSSSTPGPSHGGTVADQHRHGQNLPPPLPPTPSFLQGSRSVSDLRAGGQQIHNPLLPSPSSSPARRLRPSTSAFFQGVSQKTPEERLREQTYKSRSLSVAPGKPRIGAPLSTRQGEFDDSYPEGLRELVKSTRVAGAENAPQNSPLVLPEDSTEVETAVAQPLKTQRAKQVDIPRRKVIPQPSPPPPPPPSRSPPPPPPPSRPPPPPPKQVTFETPEHPRSALQTKSTQSSSSLFHRRHHQKQSIPRSASSFSFTNMFRFGSNKNKTSSGKSKTSWFSHSTPHQTSEEEHKSGSPTLPTTSASPEAAEALSPSQYNSLVGKRQLQEDREAQNKIDESRKLRDVFYGIKERDENNPSKKGRSGPDDISYGSPKQSFRRAFTTETTKKDDEPHNEDADDSDGLSTIAEDKAFLGASGIAAAESGHLKSTSPLINPTYKFGSDVPATSRRKGKERATTSPIAEESTTNPLAEEMARMRMVPAEQYNAAIGYDETKSGLRHHSNVMDFVERPDRAKEEVTGDRSRPKDVPKLSKYPQPDTAGSSKNPSIPQTGKARELSHRSQHEVMTYDEFGGNFHMEDYEVRTGHATTTASRNVGLEQHEGLGNTSALASASGSSSANVPPRARVAPIYAPDYESATMNPRRRTMPPPAKRLMTPACSFSAQWPYANLGTLHEGGHETPTQPTPAPRDEAAPSSSVYGPDADKATEAEDEDEGVGRAV